MHAQARHLREELSGNNGLCRSRALQYKLLREHGSPAGHLFKGATMLLALGNMVPKFWHKAPDGLHKLSLQQAGLGQGVAAGADKTKLITPGSERSGLRQSKVGGRTHDNIWHAEHGPSVKR